MPEFPPHPPIVDPSRLYEVLPLGVLQAALAEALA